MRGSDSRGGLLLLAFDKDDTLDDLGQERGAVEAAPAFLGRSGQLPNHRQGGLARATSLGSFRP